jgi:hypothetical protein
MTLRANKIPGEHVGVPEIGSAKSLAPLVGIALALALRRTRNGEVIA